MSRPKPFAWKYDKMPPLDGVVSYAGRLNPTAREATLTLTDHAKSVSQTWTFQPGPKSLERWNKLGISPVVWQFSPPKNMPFQRYYDPPYRPTSVIIAVARDVRVRPPANLGSFSVFSVKRPDLGAPLAAALQPDAIVSLNPSIRIIRVQNPALMPSFDRPESLSNCIGTPYVLEALVSDPKPVADEDFDANGDISDSSLMKLQLKRYGGTVPGLLVLPQWDGASIRSLQKDFAISIKVKDPYKPAGFAHKEFQFRSITAVWVHRNENIAVTIDAGQAAAARKRIWVFEYETGLKDVPTPGQSIVARQNLFKRVDIKENLIPGEITFIFEIAISFVPVIGTLYDLGQLAYMVATGKNFWGDDATAFDIILGGSVSALSLAIPAIRGLKSRARSKALTQIIDGINDIADFVPEAAREAPLAKALESLPPAEKNKLVKEIESAVTMSDGVAALKGVEEAVTHALQSIDGPARQALTDAMVKELFTQDLESFRDALLRLEYDDYLVRYKGNSSPLDWLLDTKREWVDAYMKRILNREDWKKVVKEAFGREGKRIIPLSMDMIRQYDKIMARGIDEYSELRKAVGKIAGMGQHFELDHLLEQRFIRQIVEWTDVISEDAAFMTILVPKNAEVAAEIVRLDPSSKLITYVHQSKTDIMRQLIPHGAEDLFTKQHIADASAYALKALSAHNDIPMMALEGDIAMLVLARAKGVDAHALAVEKGYLEAAREIGMPKIRQWTEVTDDLVSAANGFPSVEKVNGVWRVVGSP